MTRNTVHRVEHGDASGAPSGHNPALDGYGGPRIVVNIVAAIPAAGKAPPASGVDVRPEGDPGAQV